jgi:hypothetical protein
MQEVETSAAQPMRQDPDPRTATVPEDSAIGLELLGQVSQNPNVSSYAYPTAVVHPIGHSHPQFQPTVPGLAPQTYPAPSNEPETTSMASAFIGRVASVFGNVQSTQTTRPCKSDNSQSKPDYDGLVTLYKRANEKVEHYMRRNDSDAIKIKQLEVAISLKSEEAQESREKIAAMEAQVKELRSQIYSMVTGRGPEYDDEHYAGKFDKLKCLIETEMLKLSRAHNGLFLSDEIPMRLFEKLARLGEIGDSCCTVLASRPYSIQLLYTQGILRHALLRHVVALYLFQFVFRPFAFGLPDPVSGAFKFVNGDVLVKGMNCFGGQLTSYRKPIFDYSND